jgi:hypothetical protein
VANPLTLVSQPLTLTLNGELNQLELNSDVIQLEMAEVGLQGATGPPGVAYMHTQSTPSELWIINHNLGFRPIIQVFDSYGFQVMPGVFHYSDNQLRLSFKWQQSVFARML